MKTCTRCQQSLPESEFHRSGSKLKSHCKACQAKINSAWYATNKQRKAEAGRAWYKTNKERVAEKRNAWRRENPEALKPSQHRHRALKRKAEGSFTKDDLLRIWVKQEGRCAYCGEIADELTVDHVVPLSRGGSNWPSNLALACQPCNDSKGAKLLSEWEPI